MTRILSHSEVDRWISAQRARSRKVGFTCGAFDILHAGHVDYLAKARALCDRLLVAVNSDRSIREYKNPLRPLNPETNRLRVLAALRSVNAVTLLDAERPIELIQRWQPDLYIKGGDYSESQLRSAAEVEAYGGKTVLCPVEYDTSTTKLIEQAAHLSLYAAPSELEATPSRLILLDRDGTLIRNVPHLKDPSLVELLPGVASGLAELQEMGFRLILITNQQGIGLGYFDYQDFVAVNQKLLALLGPQGIKISKIYFCPHSMADPCSCRKPGAELIHRAIHDFKASLENCYFLGDTESDMSAAEAACVRSMLVREGAFGAAVATIRANQEKTTAQPCSPDGATPDLS